MTSFHRHPYDEPDVLRVSTQRIDILFRDGTRAALHAVMRHGGNERFLRAVPHAAGEHIVDLRKLVRSLGDELLLTPVQDVPYLLSQTMRLKYDGADAFIADVQAHASAGLVSV